MAQLMPLPLTVSCFGKTQIGTGPLGSPGQRAVKRVCVCVDWRKWTWHCWSCTRSPMRPTSCPHWCLAARVSRTPGSPTAPSGWADVAGITPSDSCVTVTAMMLLPSTSGPGTHFAVSDTIRDAVVACAQKPTLVRLIYRTEPTTKKCKTEKLKSKKTDMDIRRSISKQSGESMLTVLKKKRKATVGRNCGKGRF